MSHGSAVDHAWVLLLRGNWCLFLRRHRGGYQSLLREFFFCKPPKVLGCTDMTYVAASAICLGASLRFVNPHPTSHFVARCQRFHLGPAVVWDHSGQAVLCVPVCSTVCCPVSPGGGSFARDVVSEACESSGGWSKIGLRVGSRTRILSQTFGIRTVSGP